MAIQDAVNAKTISHKTGREIIDEVHNSANAYSGCEQGVTGDGLEF